jgi:zinc transporter ZupT
MIALASGFLLFHVFEKFVPIHKASEAQYGPHRHPSLGTARAAALSGHSFLDGLSIGVAFQVSPAVGTAVALAVIGHRFADGFDTTTFMVFHGNKLPHIKRWLAVVILMPILGGLVSLVYDFSERRIHSLHCCKQYLAAGPQRGILPQKHPADDSWHCLYVCRHPFRLANL